MNTVLNNNIDAFLEKNPTVKIDRIDTIRESNLIAIKNLWNDKTFMVITKDDSNLLILNNCILPPRFSAIYHRDSKELEFIFTIIRNSKNFKCCKFDINYKLCTYPCRFDISSKELNYIAIHCIENGPPIITDYRNLIMLRNYAMRDTLPDAVKNHYKDKEPMSFYISNLNTYDEDFFIDLSKHLNFYTSYFSDSFPKIIIHSNLSITYEELKQIYGEETEEEKEEFSYEQIPKTINTVELNDILMELYFAAGDSEIRMSFLLYYQIFEYSSHYFLKNESIKIVEKIIKSPDLHQNKNSYINQIIDSITEHRVSDEDKIDMLFKNIDCKDKLVPVIKKHLSYFKREIKFVGGFVLEPLIKDNITEDNCNYELFKLRKILSQLRNALVHSRESRQSQIILPIEENELKLIPYIELVDVLAKEIIIHHSQ